MRSLITVDSAQINGHSFLTNKGAKYTIVARGDGAERRPEWAVWTSVSGAIKRRAVLQETHFSLLSLTQSMKNVLLICDKRLEGCGQSPPGWNKQYILPALCSVLTCGWDAYWRHGQRCIGPAGGSACISGPFGDSLLCSLNSRWASTELFISCRLKDLTKRFLLLRACMGWYCEYVCLARIQLLVLLNVLMNTFHSYTAQIQTPSRCLQNKFIFYYIFLSVHILGLYVE